MEKCFKNAGGSLLRELDGKPGWPVENAILKAVENFFSSLLGSKAIIAPKVVGHEMSEKFVHVAKWVLERIAAFKQVTADIASSCNLYCRFPAPPAKAQKEAPDLFFGFCIVLS